MCKKNIVCFDNIRQFEDVEAFENRACMGLEVTKTDKPGGFFLKSNGLREKI